MQPKDPLAYVIRVQTPGAPAEYFVTLAAHQEEALVRVSEDLKTTNESVDFHQVLPASAAATLNLKPGDVKKYA
jgi:hypothetical protein